jgi:hypothetical protein
MDAVPAVFAALVQALMLFLFVTGAAAFGALLKGCYVLRRMARGSTRDDSGVLLKSPLVPSVSVVAAPRDASPRTREFVRRLIGLHFSQHEVVLVLDDPSPRDMETWTQEFRLIPSNRPAVRGNSPALPTAAVRGLYRSRDPLRLVVVEKEHAGANDALNAAVNAAIGEMIAIFDPQSEFVPDALLRLIRPMLEDPVRTTAVCGVAPAPPGAGWAGGLAAIESLRLWLARCAAFAGWKMLLPVPGSSLLLRRDTVLQAGGFIAGPVEMFLCLHGQARAAGKLYAVGFVTAPVSYWRPPASIAALRRAIQRDQREIGRAFAYRKSFALGLGAIGWGLPGLVAMRLLRPLAETAVYPLTIVGLALGWVPIELAELVLMASIGIGILVSMAAPVLRELAQYRGYDPAQLTRLFLMAIPENLGYRQVRNLWLIGAFFQGMRERDRRPS